MKSKIMNKKLIVYKYRIKDFVKMSNVKGIYSPIIKKRNIDNDYTFNDYDCYVKWQIIKEMIFIHKDNIIYKHSEFSYLIEYVDIDKPVIKLVPIEDVLYEDTLDFLNIHVYDIVKEIHLTESKINDRVVKIQDKKYYIQNEQIIKSLPRYIYDENRGKNINQNCHISSNENFNDKSNLCIKDLSKMNESNLKENSLSIMAI